MIIEVNNEMEMKQIGAELGMLLRGGEVLELVGDVGAGKTTLTKGIGEGLGVSEDIQSPSFTISRIYDGRDKLRLAHYDFYRLHDAGIMAHDLEEAVGDPLTVTVIEWADIAQGVLPAERLTIHISSPSETKRELDVKVRGERYQRLAKELA
jgi:tRNA threonylcarbamoyladenosine biosynthesis protein TsaE